MKFPEHHCFSIAIMTEILLFLLLINAVNSADSQYTVPSLQGKVTSPWSLSDFSTIVRHSILASNSFPWEPVEELIESGGNFDILELGKKLITHELPLLVPACLGLLLAVLVPIITLLFCCCRCCCGCCGAKLSVQSVRKHKLHYLICNAFIVLTMVGILSAMACCIPLSGERLKTSPRIIYHAVNASLDDIQLFLDAFRNDASDFAVGEINTAVPEIKARLDDLPDILSDPVTDGARPFVDKIEYKIDVLSEDIDYLEVTETQLNNSVEGIILHGDNLQLGLSTINGLYSTTKAECISEGKTFCDSLPDGAGEDALSFSIDNTKLTDITGDVTSLVAEAKQVDLAEYKTLGNSTFEELPNTVRNASQDTVDSVKATLDTVEDSLKPDIDSALEAAKFDMDFDDVLEFLDEIIKLFEDNDRIVGAVLKALASLLVLIAVMVLVGLLLGVLCTKKPKTLVQIGRSRAGHCGACLIMTSVGLAVLPLLIILLLGSILMLLGGNLTIFCAPLQDLTVFSRLLDSGLLFDGESLGAKIFNDESMNLSVTYLFRTCQRNGTIYTGLNLDSVLNLSSILNPEEFVPDLGESVVGQVNNTIMDISIVNASRFDDLVSKLELPDLDNNITQEIEDELNSIDLEAKSREISDLADTIPDETYADKYRTISTGLQQLHDDDKVPLKQSLDSLTDMINGLNITSQRMKTVVSDLATDLDDLTSFTETQAVEIVVQTIDEFLDEMRAVPDVIIDRTLDTLRTDTGKCRIIADIYDTVIGSLCVHFLDAFNVLWASFYTAGLACIILMMASCTVSKYFRRPNDLLQVRNREHQNLSMNANPSVIGTDVILTHYRSFNNEDRTNSAAYQKQNYRRFHHKWRKRQRYITGPFSAQFFKANNLEKESSDKDGKDFAENRKDSENIRYCSDVGVNVMMDNRVELGLSLPSMEEKSQDSVLLIDENQNWIPHNKQTIEGMNVNANAKASKIDSHTNVVCSDVAENEEGMDTDNLKEYEQHVETAEDISKERTNFPYIQLADDEFIVLPGTKLTTESCGRSDKTINFKAYHNACRANFTDRNESCLDNVEWLQNYKIESNTECILSSPLVKYSSDSENVLKPDITKIPDKLSSVDATELSYLGRNESDFESVTEILAKPNSVRHTSSSDVPNVMSNKLHEELSSYRSYHFPPYHIVCSLCRKKVNKDLERYENEQNEKLIISHEFSDKLRTLENVADDDQNIEVKHTISNLDIGKISKSLEDNLQTFDETFESMSQYNKVTYRKEVEKQEQSAEINEKRNPKVSLSRLDIKVQPYKPLKRMKSPRSAFLFWKYIEANCGEHPCIARTWPQESTGFDSRILKGNEKITTADSDESQKQNRTVSPHMSDKMKHAVENFEILPDYKESEQCKGVLANTPDALKNLAIAAGRSIYVRENEEQNTNTFCTVNKPDIQPRTLASISMAASSCHSESRNMQKGECKMATTVKNNTKVTYM